MSNLVLQCKENGDYTPHPEGIYVGVCNDVIDLGLVETEFQGQKRMTPKVKVSFETEAKMEDGKPFTISKNFTASLHPKARLAEFLGKWRGRPVLPGESIDLAKLIGASCTLVISHQQNLVGKTYANIDAVSKPTRKLALSGSYDAAAARQRIAEWKAKQAGSQRTEDGGRRVGSSPPQARTPSPIGGARGEGAADDVPWGAAPATATRAVPTAPAPAADYDPDVGF